MFRLQQVLAAATTLALLSTPPPLAGQEPTDISSDLIPLRNVDSTDEDFSDMAPLVDLIGDAPIVVLGELSHGFGDSFDARIRITKFLHQEMGFDVLLFETPMFLSRQMNAALAGSGLLEEAVDIAMFPIWAHSEQMFELFRYVRRSKAGSRPVDLYGIDAQLMSYPGEDSLLATELGQALAPAPTADGAPDDHVTRAIVRDLQRLVLELPPGSGTTFDAEWFRDARILLSDARYLIAAPRPNLRSRLSPLDRAWWERVLWTLDRLVEDRAVRGIAPPFRGDFEAYARHPAIHAGQNRRDQAMASNIAWMVQQLHPGRKAIVWMANSHAQEATGGRFEGAGFRPVRQHTTGSYLVGMLGADEVFTLLHSAYSGTYAGSFRFEASTEDHVWSEYEIDPAPPGTLEHALHEAGVKHAIVPLNPTPPLPGELRDVLDDDLARPASAYGDALLFLDVDRPSRPRPGAPIRRESATTDSDQGDG